MVNLNKIKERKSLKELLEFGIINIDKPVGPTSFNVSDFVRKTLSAFGIKKTSHFGTLDPGVSGVLPIALNRACKLTGFFLGEDKEYVGVMRLHKDIPLEEIKEMIKNKFLGKIKQLPPRKSRVKRVERQREIKKFEITERENKTDILFHAEVQGGTYIRKLISDLGELLGIGAHMLELRRIRAGIFSEDDKKYPTICLYKLEEAVLEYKAGNDKKLREIIIPAEIVSEMYPTVEIKSNIKNILTGKPILDSDLKNPEDYSKFGKNDMVCAFHGDRFIEMSRVCKEKEIFSRPEFVYN